MIDLQAVPCSNEIVEPRMIEVDDISADIGRKPVATKRRASTDSQKVGKRSKSKNRYIESAFLASGWIFSFLMLN